MFVGEERGCRSLCAVPSSYSGDTANKLGYIE
jgi:hypothetical protein